MVIPLLVRAPRIRVFEAIHAKIALHEQICSCSSHSLSNSDSGCFCKLTGKALRSNMGITRDVAAAAKIGKILGERLLVKNIPAVSIFLKREQKYHGKIKAVVDNMREAGVKLL